MDLTGLDTVEGDESNGKSESTEQPASNTADANVSTTASAATTAASEWRYRLIDVDVDSSANMTLAPPPVDKVCHISHLLLTLYIYYLHGQFC